MTLSRTRSNVWDTWRRFCARRLCDGRSRSPWPSPFAPPAPPPGARLCSSASSLLWLGLTSRVRASSATAPHLPDADRCGTKANRSDVRPPRFRCDPFERDVALDPGRATAPRMLVPHMLSSTFVTGSTPADLFISWLNPTPHTIAVYASRPPSPATTQHSLAGGRYPLPAPDFHRQDRTSFPGALQNELIREITMKSMTPPRCIGPLGAHRRRFGETKPLRGKSGHASDERTDPDPQPLSAKPPVQAAALLQKQSQRADVGTEPVISAKQFLAKMPNAISGPVSLRHGLRRPKEARLLPLRPDCQKFPARFGKCSRDRCPPYGEGLRPRTRGNAVWQ